MNFIRNYQKNKAKEKKIKEQLEKEEQAILEEVNKLSPEPTFSLKESIALLRGQDEEELEYESYLTEEELDNIARARKQSKKIIKTAVIFFSVAIIFAIVISRVYYDTHKSALLKVTEPLLKEYYEKKYGEKLKVKNIEELEYRDTNNKTVKSGLSLLTTKDDLHLMAKDNTLIGDDIGIQTKNQEIANYIIENLSNAELISHSIETSYQEYYFKYNRFIEYINVLPDLSVNELINSKKLTVTYKCFYNGNLNNQELLSILSNFTEDSSLYLIKQDSSGIKSLTIAKKSKIVTLNITAEIPIENDITIMELDRSQNSVTEVSVKKFVDSSASALNPKYKIASPIEITFEYERLRDENKETYYLIRLNSYLVNSSNYRELSSSKRENTYQELNDKSDYKDIILMTLGDSTYLIGSEEVLFGRITAKTSFLCNLGIC